MPSLFKDLGDSTFPGHSLKVYEDEFGAFHLSCYHEDCDWETVEIEQDSVPRSWFYKHYVYAYTHEESPLSFLDLDGL